MHLNLWNSTQHLLLSQMRKTAPEIAICSLSQWRLFAGVLVIHSTGWTIFNHALESASQFISWWCSSKLWTGDFHRWQEMISSLPRSKAILLLLMQLFIAKFRCWDSWKCYFDSVEVSSIMLLTVSCLPALPALQGLCSQHKEVGALQADNQNIEQTNASFGSSHV